MSLHAVSAAGGVLATLRNPLPDPNWPTNPTVNAVFTVGAGLAVLAGLALCVRYYRREGTAVGFSCMIGGAVASLFEPLTAANAFVYYPHQRQWTVFTAYDVQIPLFLTLAYTAEIGLGALATWRLLRAGAGPSAIYRVWLLVALGDVVLETPALWLNVFYYYGPQPLDLWGMPGWPVWTLMHTDLAEPWIWLGGLVTVALTYLFVRALAALSSLPPDAVAAMRSAVAPAAQRRVERSV